MGFVHINDIIVDSSFPLKEHVDKYEIVTGKIEKIGVINSMHK